MALSFKDWCDETGNDPNSETAKTKYDEYLDKQNRTIDKLAQDGNLGEPLHD